MQIVTEVLTEFRFHHATELIDEVRKLYLSLICVFEYNMVVLTLP